jgi:anaerobic ribonucleoside-triphosphate reductase activating protein
MNYLKITGPDIENGLGCRITLWIAGCSHHCKGCHNPETWDYNQGETLNSALNEILTKLNHSYIQGLTLSGGDPLAQTEESLKELLSFIKQIKEKFPDKDIWIYSGDVWENLIKDDNKLNILKQCDVLIDGSFILEQRDISLAFRGSSNQRIIDIQKSLRNKKICIFKNVY